MYTETFKTYIALYIGDFNHCRINHSKEFALQNNYINGIENFWSQAKRHSHHFNGIKPEHFYWFLQECEWLFNGSKHKQLLMRLIY